MSQSSGLRQRRGAKSIDALHTDGDVVTGDRIPTGAPVDTTDESISLPFWAAFAVLALVRVFGAIYYTLISDCDQTFNYEEPTHYMLYGRGLQTWEYAPQYALRSYAYTGIHALIAFVVGGGWGADKIAVFHRIHIVLALACAAGEAAFLTGIAKRLGVNTARLTLVAFICSAGLLHAAPSYLPSTFTMVGLMFGWAGWLHGSLSSSIFGVVVALVFGWPFAVIAVIPMGLHLLATQNWLKIGLLSIIALAMTCGVCVLVDYAYYRKIVLAPWNIILYNAFGVGGGGQGSDLYGVEPPSYYFRNLFLNFNVLWLLASVSPVVVVAAAIIQRTKRAVWTLVLLSQLWLWFALMTGRPHKEERFMYVVFPLIALAAVVTLEHIAQVLSCGKSQRWLYRLLVAVTLASAATLSASRIVALVHGFGAPIDAWTVLARHLQAGPHSDITHITPGVPGLAPAAAASLSSRAFTPHYPQAGDSIKVCAGKEWYRFPSSFFLPDRVSGSNQTVTFHFIKSAFAGQLPQDYLPDNGASAHRDGFNDENKEEMDRYIPHIECDYIVDFELPTSRTSQDTRYEPYFDHLGPSTCAEMGDGGVYWRSIWRMHFVHASSSNALARAFFIPEYSMKHNNYGTYHILQRTPC